jgi:hypothetical protein
MLYEQKEKSPFRHNAGGFDDPQRKRRMRCASTSIKAGQNITTASAVLSDMRPQLVFMFAALEWFKDPALLTRVAAAWPQAVCFGCSTAGEISGTAVDDGTLSLLAIGFDSPDARIEWSQTTVPGGRDSFSAGAALAGGISTEGLRHALVIAPGTDLNGSALIDGLRSVLPDDCTLSGGLAGDAGTFAGTYQFTPAGVGARTAFIIGFYGRSLNIRGACEGGWKPFGPARKATRAKGNILFDLDGEPALAIYKKYLGDYAADLPGSALLFPFETRSALRERTGILRTILAVDETQGSLTFAGSIEEGGYLTLMHASTDGLALAAMGAARSLGDLGASPKALLAISCVGRKLVMGARTEEEAEGLSDVLGAQTAIGGFYSNGEICGTDLKSCSLHNQTMTVTSFAEFPATR